MTSDTAGRVAGAQDCKVHCSDRSSARTTERAGKQLLPVPPRLKKILNLNEFEPAAARHLPRSIFGFIEGSAEDGVSARANRAAYARVALLPRVLVDTTEKVTTTRTLGREWAAPFGIAPMGAMGVAARDADRAMARAAAAADIPFVLSGASLVRMEDVIRENEHAWFQAYLSASQTDNEQLTGRVDACGFRTLVITADVAVAGNREDNLRNGYTSPLRPSLRMALEGITHPRWAAGTFLRTIARDGMPHFENYGGERVPMFSRKATRLHRRDNLSWDTLARLRSVWKHHLVLKGVLTVEDVRRARQIGVDAVIVSNHGGRQLDGAIAPLDVLPALSAEAADMPLLIDSGVRRGTDVLKALAFGAAHVFIGRPFLFAAVVGGQAGVQHAITLLRTEIERDMALLGCVDFSGLKERIQRVG